MAFATLQTYASNPPESAPDFADARLAEVDPADDGSGSGAQRPRPPGHARFRRTVSEREPVDLRDDSVKYLRRNVSLTISPVHLIAPVAELTLEIRVAGKKQPAALALIGGYGRITPQAILGTGAPDGTFAAYEVGSQLLWYPLSCFDSLQMGVEWLFVKVVRESATGQAATGNGTAYSLGPFVGYKWISKPGFTLLAQAGVAYVKPSSGGSDSGSDSDWSPLLNFNLGWSF